VAFSFGHTSTDFFAMTCASVSHLTRQQTKPVSAQTTSIEEALQRE
jgi:hypothetical protein